MRVDQIGLLLWKNYIVRKRQPGILALVFLWPIAVFMILYTIRDNVEPEYNPTCHFPARSMPQDGLLPFVQSFVCSVGNPCDPLAEYEEVPSYKNAALGPLMTGLQPMLNNDTVMSAVVTLPKSIQLLKSMAQILTKPEIKALFDRGIRLGDLFTNHEEIKKFLKTQMPDEREGFVDNLFDSSIKLLYLIQMFGTSNIDGVICSTDSLKKYLILPNEEDYANVSRVLCEIDSEKIPAILENLSKHMDFSGLLAMIDRAMAKFRDYDFYIDLKKAVETILDLNIMKDNIPKYLKLESWLPKMILLFKNVTFKQVDLTFINKSVALLDPVFDGEYDWKFAKRGLLQINSILGMVNNLWQNRNVSSSDDNFYAIVEQLAEKLKSVSWSDASRDVTEILDLMFLVVQDGIHLTNKLLDHHKDDIQIAAEVLDGLKNFFSKNIVNILSYLTFVADNIVKALHHVAIIHEDMPRRIYEVLITHQDFVRNLTTNFSPTIYRALIHSLSRLEFQESLVEQLEKTKPEDLICQNHTFYEIFEKFTNMPANSEKMHEMLCNEKGKKFVAAIYNSFEFDYFSRILENCLASIYNIVLHQPIAINRSNLTSVVQSARKFAAYLQSPTQMQPDWTVFNVSEEWIRVFNETQSQARLNVVGYHLSIAKITGEGSISYLYIKPDLQSMDILAEWILQDLRTQPTSWVGQVLNHKPELIEAFYLTATDREKALKFLEYSNFTRPYCTAIDPPALIIYPRGSNETLLRDLVCRVGKSVETYLEYNVTEVALKAEKRDLAVRAAFNWTGFNDKVVEIYRYLDTLLHQDNRSYDPAKFAKLRLDFAQSWMKNITVKDGSEISVGLLCKLFDVMKRPVFEGIQTTELWSNAQAIAWAVSVVFDSIETIVNEIQANDNVAELSVTLHDLPQTGILLSAFLRNLPSIILDAVDLTTMKLPVHFISTINEYKKRETMWPCVMKESIGEVLEFRNGTREAVRELERIACNPGLFIKEWREQPVLAKVRKIFQNDSTTNLPPFNWTNGYVKFRRLVGKFDALLKNASAVVLAENPKLLNHIKAIVPEIDNIVDERLPETIQNSKNILEYIDLEIDKTVDAFKSNLTARRIWKQDVSKKDRYMVLAKFISHVVHESSRVVTEVLNDGEGKISWLSLLGFTKDTPVGIFYNQFPFVLATLINGMSEPTVENKVIESLELGGKVSCSDLFDWWSDFRIGLNPQDYLTLKNFTCDLDPGNFNAYTNLYKNEYMIWDKPVNTYRSFCASAAADLYNVGKVIRKMTSKKTAIEAPFSRNYLTYVMTKLKSSLEGKHEAGIVHENLRRDSGWKTYKLIVEGISEVLAHISEALPQAISKGNFLKLSDLFKNGDVRQLLNILEAHPEESIVLATTLSSIDPVTNSVVPYENIKKEMCVNRFNSSYWSEKERTHFLMEVCSFDPLQLLQTATSREFYDLVTGQTPTLSRSTPLSLSVTKLLDVISNATSVNPDLVVKSSILNATTWKHLSKDALSILRKAEESWIHSMATRIEFPSAWKRNYYGEPTETTVMIDISRTLEVLDALADVLAGGDTWQKLRNIYESSKVKPLLTLAEDTPNLVLTFVDTFVSSERLGDFFEKLFEGKLGLCDLDRYLIPPSFMRKKSLLSSITNYCQKIAMKDSYLQPVDFLPFNAKLEENYMTYNVSKNEKTERVFNRTYMVDRTYHFQTTLIRFLSDGFKEPKVPTWWTSFEEGTYKDFITQYKKNDMRTLAHTVVKKIMKILKDMFNVPENAEDCSWCNTLMIEIVNSQLSHHRRYANLLCELKNLNFSQLQEILVRDFYWNKTSNMIKDYKYLNKKQTVNDFFDKFGDTLNYIADIMVDYQNETYGMEVSKCFYQFVGKPAYSRPGLYVSMLIGILDTIKNNINIVDTASNHAHLGNLTRLAENTVPIWKPLRDVVKKTDIKIVEKILPNATINVNAIMNDRNHSLCRNRMECRNSTILYEMLSSKRAGKLLRYDPKASNYPSVVDISGRLAESLDLAGIDREKRLWRQQASWELVWLKEILQHLSIVLGKAGNLLDVASKVDFEDVSNVLGVPDLADGIVNLLKDNTIDKLFAGMKEILEDVAVFFDDPAVFNDLNSMITALESMEIFKNLGLLDLRYAVRDMFDNWDTVREYLVENVNITNDLALTLSQGKIDMLSIFLKERRAISLKETICSPEKLADMLYLDEKRLTAEEVSSALCKMDDSKTQNVTITLVKNLNFDYIFKNLMSANVKNILANANLTETEGKTILDNLGVASELLPFFRDKLSQQLSSPKMAEDDSEKEEISSSMFLKDSSEMLCGRTLVSDSGQLYKIISSIEDNSKQYDKRELDSLPTEFCRETYKGVLGMTGGKIIWSYIKPLLRGKILYAPKSRSVDRVMALANDSFSQMERFGALMNSFEATLVSLANLSEMGDSLRELQDVMSSDVMKIAIKSMGGGNFDGDFSELDLSEIAWRLKHSPRLIKMVGMLNDLMECVLVDRIHGYADEEELEKVASFLTETNEFLAGVVFVDDASGRQRRSSWDYRLPENVTYKIRMDVDYVPSTRRLKNQFWMPGPEGSFVEDLRYLRGFVQLQDSIDRAIIRVKSGKDQNWKTLTQQMPYPCWKFTPFQQTLYESQGVQMCFFFALMMCVGSAVRHIVWERESRNSMVMSVMGLKPWRNTLAWFLTSYAELTIVMISISLILLAGKILPKSDPLLVLLLLFDYIFSVVTFCYMISTMFSSASLAAVTAVVMFLLTYMPYVIVIAMEAVLGLGYKLLICLSMSTSFCYGCLYAVRKEVQGVGLSWSNLWEESSPGDPMSLGLVLLMLALDGCIYGVIGFFVARYTNSGKGFHGLRSRSLWWADTRSLYGRPTYLTFVNNLYFTNDVLHPSTSYQEDDSDDTSLTVSEKQIGVRFENVRKVFQTGQGEVVAVDDFSLKLCEGEVTSLLGRNGAGKTTIIKMLTGMLVPTSGEICLNGEEAFKPDIGVCPQDNVLISTLTPREHMIFYSRLKRSANTVDVQHSVNEMLTSLELGRREHEPVSRLSGGTKRRLCVALAFLGNPKLVILDEPGAGVDPAARRRIWKLIDQHRIGRTVLLSTHHLDEADMLSDTVVVMHRGKILCTGSPLSLKTTYGRGYKLHISFPLGQDSNRDSVDRKCLENLKNVVEDVVPNAVINEVSGSEVVVNLPFQSKHGGNNDIAQAAKALEGNSKLLGFTHFSLECDTLERVFLDLCTRADTGSTITRNSMDSVNTQDNIGLSIPNDEIDLIDNESSPRPSPLRQAKALLKKRLWHFAKDWRAPLATLILPTIFVAVAMGFSLIRPPSADEPPLVLTPKLYDTHPTYFYSIDGTNEQFLQDVSLQLHDRFGDDYAGAWQTLPNDTGTCECQEGQQTCHGGSQAVEGLLQTLPGRPTLDWIVSTHQQYIERRYGGWSLSHAENLPLFVVWYNNKGHHSLPAYLNALNEAILRATGARGHLTTINHPLKLSSDQLNRTSLLQHVADVGIALVLLIAFSLVSAQGTKELVRERLSEEKRILYLAGVHPITYWTTALIWDLLVFGCSICLAVIVFEIFGLSTYVARDNLPGVCLLLALFAWASTPFGHLAEKAFDDSSLSNMVLFCVNTFIGVASLATILVIDILGKTQAAADTRKILHNILLLFPQYALGDALVELSKNDITADLLQKFGMDTYKSPLGWELLGLHYVSLAIIGGILFLANLTIECRLLPDLRRRKIVYEVVQEDEDVAKERVRVEGDLNGDTLKMVKLRKEYNSVYGTNVAVQNLSLGVQPGTCFGLLGVNGAGKSTTFRMLTTETIATAGKIILRGEDIHRGPLCSGDVGYCPQTDALDGFLTPHQCLTIHGEVCGLTNVPKNVETILKRFDLIKYAHRRVDSLSGGNKRKLCTAISVMAPVSVVLMDEPTSGMDPATKELVAKAIRRVTKNQTCVVLTSHSVAECENLCSRVGILAKAGLRCIGTPQHLKHKFGEGYVAFLRFGQPVAPADLRRALNKHLPQALISSRQANAARLLVPRNGNTLLSDNFAKVKLLAEELKATDFTLTQSSLDQVLVNFSEELEDETIDPSKQGHVNIAMFPNTHNSSDAIHMETF